MEMSSDSARRKTKRLGSLGSIQIGDYPESHNLALSPRKPQQRLQQHRVNRKTRRWNMTGRCVALPLSPRPPPAITVKV